MQTAPQALWEGGEGPGKSLGIGVSVPVKGLSDQGMCLGVPRHTGFDS